MKHDPTELGERADTHGHGRFYLLQHPADDAPPAGRWEAGMGGRDYHDSDVHGHGETPDAAVQDLLNRQEPQAHD